MLVDFVGWSNAAVLQMIENNKILLDLNVDGCGLTSAELSLLYSVSLTRRDSYLQNINVINTAMDGLMLTTLAQ